MREDWVCVGVRMGWGRCEVMFEGWEGGGFLVIYRGWLG